MFPRPSTLEAALLQHFIHHKVEIAYAISKPFPFFEGLRDSSFITERLYRESLEAYRNYVPMTRVVYRMLTELEKTFSLLVLQNLFSHINLHEYPKLQDSLQGFVNVATSYGSQNRVASRLLEVSMADGSPLQVRRLEPSQGSTHAGHRTELLANPPSPAGPSVELQKERLSPASRQNDHGSQEAQGVCPGPVQVSSNLSAPKNVEEDAQEVPSVASDLLPDDPPEPDGPEEPQEAPRVPPSTPRKGKKRKRSIWSTPKKRSHKKSTSRDTAAPDYGLQEQLQVGDQVTPKKDDSPKKDDTPKMDEPPGKPKVITRAQRAKTNRACATTPEEAREDSSEPNQGSAAREAPSTPRRARTEKRREPSWESPRRSKRKGTASPGHGSQEQLQKGPQAAPKNDSPPKRAGAHGASKVMARAQRARTSCNHVPVPEEPGDERAVFSAPVLPVTCGEARGLLYTQRLKRGPAEKCIQNGQGQWVTPQEFEAEGRRAKSKKWKRSLRCRGQTLGQLLKKGLLFCPPRVSTNREGWKECGVCCGQGALLDCDTCHRAFHGGCHIPAVGAGRKPWSCTFCRMKEYSGNQQRLGGSQAPERQMGPEEQLKCELLLLRAYCHPQGAFFAGTPSNIRAYGEPFKEPMWLDLVRERLAEGVYTVAWFVRDMRLIFHNHQAFHQDSDLGHVGLDLEAEFEKNLKETLTLHGARENGFGES